MQYRSRLHEFCLEYISLYRIILKITLKGLGFGTKNLPSAHFIPPYYGTNTITCNLLLLTQYFLYFLVMQSGRFSWFCCRRNAQNLITYQWKCNLNGLEGFSEQNRTYAESETCHQSQNCEEILSLYKNFNEYLWSSDLYKSETWQAIPNDSISMQGY
jgi:hypothetical protein